MLVLFDLWQRPEIWSQVLLPAMAFHQHSSIQSNQLWDVDPHHSAVLHNTSNLRQSVHSGLSKELLDEAEAPVRDKLGVAYDQEVKVQIVVELKHGPPDTIPEHKHVLVLAPAVITIQVHMSFPYSVVGEEMVHVVDDCAAAFACYLSF